MIDNLGKHRFEIDGLTKRGNVIRFKCSKCGHTRGYVRYAIQRVLLTKRRRSRMLYKRERRF